MKKVVWPLLWIILPKSTTAIALYPFVIFKDRVKLADKKIINHERIHLKQQLELLLVFFYLIYAIEYLVLLLLMRNHSKAYRSISFEREAYTFDSDLEYLKKRKPYSMWR